MKKHFKNLYRVQKALVADSADKDTAQIDKKRRINNMAKQANGSGSIRQKNGRFEGRYTIGVDENGRQIQKFIYGASKTEVKQKMQKALAAISADKDTAQIDKKEDE